MEINSCENRFFATFHKILLPKGGAGKGLGLGAGGGKAAGRDGGGRLKPENPVGK